MERIRDNPFTGPLVWKRNAVHLVPGITRCLSGGGLSDERSSLRPAFIGRLEQNAPMRTTRILATLGEVAGHVRSELLYGCGFTMVHDIGLEDLDLEVLKRRYCKLGSQLGVLAPQNADGDLLRSVTDLGRLPGNYDSGRARGHRGRARMNPHSDSADIAALLCVRPAKRGGANSVCSAAAIYNEILARRPEYLKPLCRGFHFDLSGKTHNGLGATEQRIPVFSYRNGKLSCVFNKDRIILGMKKAGQPLEDVELASVEYLHALAKSDEFTIRLTMKAGDILFLNNHCTLHGRDEYDDWPEVNRKRLLLRLWMNLPVAWDSLEAGG